MIVASDWLTTVEDRHVFNVWRHQHDVFHVWRHWRRHNGDRDRLYCNPTIVKRGFCASAPGPLVMWLFQFQTIGSRCGPRLNIKTVFLRYADSNV